MMAGYSERRQRLKEERAERESLEQKQDQRKRMFAYTGLLIGAGLVCIAAANWLSQGVATPVSGRLAGISELAFVEGTQGDGGISPVCGCKDPPVDSWRGVQFAGRRVSLAHRGHPWTQWAISSAEPERVELGGDVHFIHAEAFRVEAGDGFDPSSLLARDPTQRTEVVRQVPVEAYGFSMFTRGRLQVSLGGPAPIGAWIPFPGSRVQLAAVRSQFPNGRLRPRLVERYPASVGFWADREGGSNPREPQIYPIGDFLGPDLVIWTRDPRARIAGTRFRHPAGPGVITAVVIPPSIFSTRIGVAGLSASSVRDFESMSLEGPNSDAERVIDASGLGGTVTLTVEDPLGPPEYRAVRRRIHADPTTVIRIPAHAEPGGDYFGEGGMTEEQRFPPLPDKAGFNVFGPLAAVAFDDVYGHLTVSDDHVDLRGSADVVLRDVERLHDDDDQQLISAPLTTADDSANLQFTAEGKVTVNDVTQATAQTKYERPLGAIGLALSLVT